MNKYKGTTKVSLTIRILVGAYLLYTAYTLFKGIPQYTGNEKIVFILFSIFFAVIGALLIFFSGKALLNKQYDDGSCNDEEEPENENAINLNELGDVKMENEDTDFSAGEDKNGVSEDTAYKDNKEK